MFAFWSQLRNTPFYKREKGMWGNPNEFYTYANRFAPLLIIGSLFLGMCGGITNFASTSDTNSEALVMFYCFYCLPTIGVQMLTWTGVVMIPTLTAPIISEELKRGTWDMLMVTPYPIQTILWAKAIGGLSRLYIWWPLLILSIVQFGGTLLAALLIFSTVQLGADNIGTLQTLFLVALTGLGLSLRPWIELFFVILVGLCCSTATKSGGVALAVTYSIVIIAKMICSNTLWLLLTAMVVSGNSNNNTNWIPIGGSYIPMMIYAVLITATFFLLRSQMEHLATEGLPES